MNRIETEINQITTEKNTLEALSIEQQLGIEQLQSEIQQKQNTLNNLKTQKGLD